MDIKKLDLVDTQKMYHVYDEWPQIARKAFESNLESISLNDINYIVFAGMGGSGAIGDLFSSILSETNIHVDVVKGYQLPKTVNSKTLVIVISVSGETEESLSILKMANEQNSKIIAFSSGGKMEKVCNQNKIKHIQIPQIHSPRASFSLFFYSILKVLHKSLNIKYFDIIESINQLEQLSKKINSTNLTDGNPALKLAEWIKSIPIIYCPFGLNSASYRYKTSMQENAKMHVICEDIIETSHNGIVAWESKSVVEPILIRGIDDSFKTNERFEIIKEFFNKNNIEYKEIVSVRGNILSKLICLIYLLDYSSIYNAIIQDIDPSPVKAIKYVKSQLKKRNDK
jgi:glucose/mannose-6-phosphate isomerase